MTPSIQNNPLLLSNLRIRTGRGEMIGTISRDILLMIHRTICKNRVAVKDIEGCPFVEPILVIHVHREDDGKRRVEVTSDAGIIVGECRGTRQRHGDFVRFNRMTLLSFVL